jgi:hypothetical protein
LLFKQVLSVVTGRNAFEGVTTQQEEINELTGEKQLAYLPIQQYEIENMRKNLAGISYTLAVLTAGLLIRGMLPSQEERRRRKKAGLDKSSYTRLCLNLLGRTQQDLLFYADPGTATQLMGSLIPSVNVITDTQRLMGSYFRLLADDPNKWEKLKSAHTKAIPILNNINRMKVFTDKDILSIQHN